MKVYIEQVLITNFIIDFCILIIISKFIFSKPNYKHIVIASIFGSLATLVYPFINGALLINILKILTSIIMLQIIRIHKKQLLKSCLLMLVISYVIGGAILSNFGTQTNNGYAINSINLIYVFATTLIFTIISSKLVTWVKNKICTNSNIYPTTLTYNNKKITIKSFIDSGNALLDNNQPVSLINLDTFLLLTNLTLNQYLKGDFSTLTNPHFISANTITGKRKILVFTIDELQIKQKIYKNIILGVALNFDNTKEYKAILNSSFCFN